MQSCMAVIVQTMVSAHLLTFVCTLQVNGFAALIVLRIGFAIAQAAQNPVCFGAHQGPGCRNVRS